MKFMKKLLMLSIGAWSALAEAHPHSFVDLKNQVLIENNKLKGFKMEWTMDEIASAELIYEVNNSPDKAHTIKSITDEMTQTAVEAHYFSYLYDTQNKPIKFTSRPTDTSFKIDNNRVTFYITFYVSQPYDLKNRSVRFYTYESSYYIAMEYNKVQDVSIDAAQCKAEMSQPKVSNALKLYASSLDKNQSPDSPENDDNSLGAQFAQKVSIVCN